MSFVFVAGHEAEQGDADAEDEAGVAAASRAGADEGQGAVADEEGEGLSWDECYDCDFRNFWRKQFFLKKQIYVLFVLYKLALFLVKNT
jgi:hypothetical protein